MQNDKNYLFISGCDRSGTTAAVRLLNAHQDICIGMERYKFLINEENSLKTLNKNRFSKELFFNILDEETNIQWDYFYDPLKEKFDKSKFVGDKVPRYFQVYNHLKNEFPTAKHIFLVRDPLEVANSWKVRAADSKDVNWLSSNDVKKSVNVWNSSLKQAYKRFKEGHMDIIIISYTDLFSGDKQTLDSILNFLSLEQDDNLSKVFYKMTDSWGERLKKPTTLTEEEIQYVSENANNALAKHALSLKIYDK